MKFTIDNPSYNNLNLMRRLGYHPHKKNDGFIRRMSHNEFPRFHVYLKDLEESFEMSLHLDQKGVCYEGQTAHSGEYDSKILEEEKQRIITQLRE